MFWLRASIGAELSRDNGISNFRVDRDLEELVRIYWADRAEQPVAPPSRRLLRRLGR